MTTDSDSDELESLGLDGLADAVDEDEDAKVKVCWEETELKACVESERPAVLKKCERYEWWPNFFSIQYLRETCGDRTVRIDTRDRRLNEYFDSLENGAEESYLRNKQVCDLLSAEECSRFKLPITALGANVLPEASESLPRAWRQWFEVFVLPCRSRGYPFLHKDVCSTHAYSMQLHGKKRFTLYPPDNSPFLYPQPPSFCRSVLPEAGRAVDLTKFPKFAKARPFTVLLEPGDLFFLPRNFWHSTRPEPSSGLYSITIGGNFVSPQAYPTFRDDFADFAAMRNLARDHPHAATLLS